jgi:hypothetical protein
MSTGKRKILQEYLTVDEMYDLHLLDKERNHDKVYHIAVAARPDGKFDVLCRFGRRGSGMQDFVAGEGLSISSARNIASDKASEKKFENYQESPGISPGIWSNIFLPVTASDVSKPEVVEPRPDPKPSMTSNAEIPDYAPREWFY